MSVVECKIEMEWVQFEVLLLYFQDKIELTYHVDLRFGHNVTSSVIIILTSSSAVAKRPHDASCLLVVSFNSTNVPLNRSPCYRALEIVVTLLKHRVVFYC